MYFFFSVVVAEMAKFVTFPFVSSSEFLSEFKARVWGCKSPITSKQMIGVLISLYEPWPRPTTLSIRIYFLKSFASLVLEKKEIPNTNRDLLLVVLVYTYFWKWKKLDVNIIWFLVDEPVLQFFKLELMWDTQNAKIAFGQEYFTNS